MARRLPTAQRRRQIADAALRRLAEGGPRALTLQALGQDLGVSDVSILRHFPNKAAIVRAAIERFGALLDEDLCPEVPDPLDRLGTFVVRRLTKAAAHPELIALAYNTRLVDAAQADRADVDRHIERSARFVREAIAAAQARGVVRDDVPPTVWLWVIAGVVRGVVRAIPAGLHDDARPAPDAAQAWTHLRTILTTQSPVPDPI